MKKNKKKFISAPNKCRRNKSNVKNKNTFGFLTNRNVSKFWSIVRQVNNNNKPNAILYL